MSAKLTLHLSTFGQDALERLARDDAASRDATIRTALLYYLSERESGRVAWPAPHIQAVRDGAPRTRVEFALDPRTSAEVSAEASRQEVTVEELAAHAFAYFLADLEAGRLAALLAANLDLDDES